MKRSFLILLITLLTFSFIYSKNLKLQKEIDLSFFLKPHQPHLVYVAADTQGFIFVTQRGKDQFIKIDPAGEVMLRAPQKIEGEIIRLDIDQADNVVCLFTGRMAGESPVLPLIWFEGNSGQKIRETNLGEIFNLVVNLKILRPKDHILVNGILKDERLPMNSLHIIDFNLNVIKSFSPLRAREKDITSSIRNNQDYFSSPPKYDPESELIFQAFPEAGVIKCFDLNGNQVAETEWVGKDIFLVHSGELWIKGKDGFGVFKKNGNRFEPSRLAIKDDRGNVVHWYPVAQDMNSRFYFLGGKEFQTLMIYSIED